MNHATRHKQQRGAATLVVTLVLMFAMTLAAYFLNRNMALEQRLAANQVHAAQAFEAAEAGLEWATAQLNDPQKMGPDCRASGAATAQSFRASRVAFDASTGLHTPRTWNQGAQVMPLQAVCVRNPAQASGWDCGCPASGHPSMTATAATAATTANASNAAPAFVVTLMPTALPGQLRVVAQGCTSHAGACKPGSNSKADTTAQVQQLVALVSGLAGPPSAALTVLGNVNTNAALGLHTATRAAVQAGGAVTAPNARIGVAAGGVSSLAIVDHDPALRSLNEDRFFSRLLGMDAAMWSQQSMVRNLVCQGNCNVKLIDAVAKADGPALLWVDGDLNLTGPLNVGSGSQPVLLVVNGTATLSGSVQINGLLHAARVEWNADGTESNGSGKATGRVTGAVTSASDYSGNGAPDLVFDAAVLQLLKANSGSFARVAGSWKDF
jgi:Tfp pilus assembly protein PilX